MLTHPTLDQIASLGLNGMAAAWRALADQDPGEALNRKEWLGLLLDREVAWRADKRFANRPKDCKNALAQRLHRRHQLCRHAWP